MGAREKEETGTGQPFRLTSNCCAWLQVLEAVLAQVRKLRGSNAGGGSVPSAVARAAGSCKSAEALQNSANLGLLVLEVPSGKVRYASKRFEELFEWLMDETIEGIRFSSFLPLEDAEAFRAFLCNLMDASANDETSQVMTSQSSHFPFPSALKAWVLSLASILQCVSTFRENASGQSSGDLNPC
jgi:PAS domain-containing protein